MPLRDLAWGGSRCRSNSAELPDIELRLRTLNVTSKLARDTLSHSTG